MFEVGFTEILLILGLALLVLGPEKLPGLAEKVGRWTGRARAMARQLRTQLEQEVNLEEMARSRPMQAPPPPPDVSPPPAGASEPPAPGASDVPPDPVRPGPVHADPAHNEPAHSGPGLDLDATVSGIEPQQSQDTTDPTKPAP
jgi:sec-independent protein translocase protein TatB